MGPPGPYPMRPPVPAVAEPPLVGAHRAVLETGGGQVVWRCARTSAGAGGGLDAARIRNRCRLRLPDAVQVATALGTSGPTCGGLAVIPIGVVQAHVFVGDLL